MSYKVIIRDADIQNAMGGRLNESVEAADVSLLTQRISSQSGIKVYAKVNESTKEVEIKRLLIG